MANVDAVDSLGMLPYRLAKPILTLMTPEKLMEIEKNSPVRSIIACNLEFLLIHVFHLANSILKTMTKVPLAR